jgi:hypothetical protein
MNNMLEFCNKYSLNDITQIKETSQDTKWGIHYMLCDKDITLVSNVINNYLNSLPDMTGERNFRAFFSPA